MTPEQKVKFLIVDDLEGNLLALEGLLRRDGLLVLKARSGPEALEWLLAHDIALAIIDVQMPVMDGFELAELMRGTERTRRVPIIFLTAGAVDQQRRFRGYEAGAVDFLFKPIEPHVLRSKADVFFELDCHRQELARQRETLETTVQERTAKLRETIAELEAFSYSISHDMRAPLRAMQGYALALLEDYGDKLGPEARDYLERIQRASRRMDDLIRDVLTYSKVAKGDVQLRAIELDTIVADVRQNYPDLQSLGSRLRVASPLPRVLGHEAYLTQVVSNLLGNAAKFVAPGVLPEVLVDWESRGDAVRIWFKDNGIGIASEHLDRIFQIFGRVYSQKEYEGNGIGLVVAKKAVERMDGRIGVESEVGKGSKFWIELRKAP